MDEKLLVYYLYVGKHHNEVDIEELLVLHEVGLLDIDLEGVAGRDFVSFDLEVDLIMGLNYKVQMENLEVQQDIE